MFLVYRNEGIYRYSEIKLLPELVHYYNVNNNKLLFDSDKLPMITSPIPWTSVNSGGYLLTSSSLLRINLEKNAEQFDFIQSSKPNEMYPIYDSLNLLGSCPWRINTRVFPYLNSLISNLF